MHGSETLDILVTGLLDAGGLCAWAAVPVSELATVGRGEGQGFLAVGVSAQSLDQELARWARWLQNCEGPTLRIWVETQDAAWQELARQMQTCGAAAFVSARVIRDYVTLLEAQGQPLPARGSDCLENTFSLAQRLRPWVAKMQNARPAELRETVSRRPLCSMRGVESVIFLDFDGVLQTPSRDDWLEMEHCDELVTLLEEMPSLGLVVTTTHRETSSQDEVLAMLPPALLARVVGLTEVTLGGRALGGRQREVMSWLRAHPQVQSWVAVDDEYVLFERDCPWLVITHKWLGWTSQTTEQVRRLLSREPWVEAPPPPENPYARKLAATRRDAVEGNGTVVRATATVAGGGAAGASRELPGLTDEAERALRVRLEQMRESPVRRLWRRAAAWWDDVLG